jgi:hypothetical protein
MERMKEYTMEIEEKVIKKIRLSARTEGEAREKALRCDRRNEELLTEDGPTRKVIYVYTHSIQREGNLNY